MGGWFWGLVAVLALLAAGWALLFNGDDQIRAWIWGEVLVVEQGPVPVYEDVATSPGRIFLRLQSGERAPLERRIDVAGWGWVYQITAPSGRSGYVPHDECICRIEPR